MDCLPSAILLYEEAIGDSDFEASYQIVASRITKYLEFVDLLRLLKGHNQICPAMLTFWQHEVWEKVLEKGSLSKTVKMIGGDTHRTVLL